jgi:hypothetical protein
MEVDTASGAAEVVVVEETGQAGFGGEATMLGEESGDEGRDPGVRIWSAEFGMRSDSITRDGGT